MKKTIIFLTTALFLLTLTSCSAGSKAKPSQPLSIGVLPDVDSIPVIIAEHNGYFKEEGLTLQIEHFKGAPDRDSALQSGKIDGAVSDILAAAFARDGGFDVRITSMTNGTYKLLAGKNSGINAIADLKGKSIAISKNTIIEYSTDRMLEQGNLTSEDVKKTVIPQIPVRLEMLQNGKLDAATLPEPLASVAVKGGAKLINSTDQLGINPGVILFTSKTIKNKSQEIKSFYAAYNKAVEYLQKEKPSSYMDVLIKESSFPEDVKSTLSIPSYTRAALPSSKDLNAVIDWLKGKELIKNVYSFDDLVDNSFVR